MRDASGNRSDNQRSAALNAVLSDPRLDGADRLKGFLTYIVEEELAGRGEKIRGKTIAQDVYGRDTSEGTDPENVVRVDARRLRQALELYYQTDGQSDPIRIHLDSGGYRPRFEEVETGLSPARSLTATRAWVPVATFAVGAVLGGFLASFVSPAAIVAPPETLSALPSTSTAAQVTRAAIYEKSPSALQAFNLAEQARGMMFPIFDRPRQELVLSVFERVIELDPDYFGGYAGAAQALATLAIISPPSDVKAQTTAAAMTMAETAVRLAPNEAWSQSAKSWASFASGDHESAIRLSARAAQIDPEDPHVQDFFGSVSLFSGAFEDAARSSERDDMTVSSNQRFARRNISGAANFHLGNYALTVQRFDEAAEFGDPISAPSLAYHTAALSLLGRERQAKSKLNELERGWPNAPIDSVLRSIHRDPSHANDVIEQLELLGWQKATPEVPPKE